MAKEEEEVGAFQGSWRWILHQSNFVHSKKKQRVGKT